MDPFCKLRIIYVNQISSCLNIDFRSTNFSSFNSTVTRMEIETIRPILTSSNGLSHDFHQFPSSQECWRRERSRNGTEWNINPKNWVRDFNITYSTTFVATTMKNPSALQKRRNLIQPELWLFFFSLAETYSTTASKSLALQKTCFASVPKSTCDILHAIVKIKSIVYTSPCIQKSSHILKICPP